MQKRSFYLLLLLSLFYLTPISAQEVTVSETDPDRYAFWITVRAQIKISRETRKEAYVVRTARNKPKAGRVIDFEEFLYKSLQSGRQIPIGPFYEYQDAKRAAEMYKLAKHTTKTMEEAIKNYNDSTALDEYYWFFLKFKILPRTKSMKLIRTAARVASGDLKEFRQVLWEGLFFKQLAIGPFASQLEAEEAKRLYRLEED